MSTTDALFACCIAGCVWRGPGFEYRTHLVQVHETSEAPAPFEHPLGWELDLTPQPTTPRAEGFVQVWTIIVNCGASGSLRRRFLWRAEREWGPWQPGSDSHWAFSCQALDEGDVCLVYFKFGADEKKEGQVWSVLPGPDAKCLQLPHSTVAPFVRADNSLQLIFGIFRTVAYHEGKGPGLPGPHTPDGAEEDSEPGSPRDADGSVVDALAGLNLTERAEGRSPRGGRP
jgi:hypothetical protein